MQRAVTGCVRLTSQDQTVTTSCTKCGYVLRGLRAADSCPECGLPQLLCDTCGTKVGRRDPSIRCPHCGSETSLTEWELRRRLVLPWRCGASGVWFASATAGSWRSSFPLWGTALSLLALVLMASTARLACKWHRVAVLPGGGIAWSWRANMSAAHWVELLRPGAGSMYGYPAQSVLYLPGRPVGLQVRVGNYPSLHEGARVETYEQQICVRSILLEDLVPAWMAIIASPIVTLAVGTLVPPFGLWLLTAPGTRLTFLRAGARRLRCVVWMGVCCQGAWLLIVTAYDLTTPLTRLPFLGLLTFGVDVLIGLFVSQVLVLRGVLFDQAQWVFCDRGRVVAVMGGGIVVTIVLMVVGSVAMKAILSAV